jgi:hypothetical protein
MDQQADLVARGEPRRRADQLVIEAAVAAEGTDLVRL